MTSDNRLFVLIALFLVGLLVMGLLAIGGVVLFGRINQPTRVARPATATAALPGTARPTVTSTPSPIPSPTNTTIPTLTPTKVVQGTPTPGADHPLSLSATIVFEQSYGGVEGDSASSAEYYALLSALSEVPLKQAIAVTGSVNQHGVVQPVGGINEKIEGFFDVCQAAGLTGEQGVLIPAANKRHLMLRDDVVRAVDAGRFHVHAIDTVDQGIEVLTGLPAGTRDREGHFSAGSVNGLVERRLMAFAAKARDFLGYVDRQAR